MEVEDHKFKRPSCFEYLGSIIPQDNEIKNIIQVGNRCYYGLRSMFGFKLLSKKLKVQYI